MNETSCPLFRVLAVKLREIHVHHRNRFLAFHSCTFWSLSQIRLFRIGLNNEGSLGRSSESAYKSRSPTCNCKLRISSSRQLSYVLVKCTLAKGRMMVMSVQGENFTRRQSIVYPPYGRAKIASKPGTIFRTLGSTSDQPIERSSEDNTWRRS